MRPSQPPSANALTNSVGYCAVRSRSSQYSCEKPRASAATSLRISSCDSVSAKSMAGWASRRERARNAGTLVVRAALARAILPQHLAGVPVRERRRAPLGHRGGEGAAARVSEIAEAPGHDRVDEAEHHGAAIV